MRQRRDLEALARRRRAAAKLFTKGVPQAEVARRLRVSRQSVSRWYRTWSAEGTAALVDAGRAGRPPRLTADQKARVEEELLRGPTAHGYATQLWTLARVVEVIERVTGVRYHPGHVWRLLHELGWSVQRPARRAAERDEEAAIARWIKKDWPRVKKARDAAGRGSSSKTSPVFSLTPVVRATWAPNRSGRGATAQVQLEADEHVRGAVLPPRPLNRYKLVFATHPGAYTTETLIDFLRRLPRPLRPGRQAHPALGRTIQPPQPRHDRLHRLLPRLAARRTPARLRPRTQPGRRPVGHRQRNRTANRCPDTIDEAMQADAPAANSSAAPSNTSTSWFTAAPGGARKWL